MGAGPIAERLVACERLGALTTCHYLSEGGANRRSPPPLSTRQKPEAPYSHSQLRALLEFNLL